MLLGGSLHVLYVESNVLLGEYVLCSQAAIILPIHLMLLKSIPVHGVKQKKLLLEKQMF